MVAETYQLTKTKKIFLYAKKLAQAVCLLPLFLSSVRAESIRLVSDEETELFLADVLRPIYQAAGIPFNRRNIFIVEDNSLNAFVGDGNNMFVHTGTLTGADNANQLAGVLAHETGHIQGGHILRQKIKMQDIRQASLASMVAAGVLGAVTGRADVGMAVLMGTGSSAFYNMNYYQVQEERSADEAAVRLLAATKQSPAGMRDFMKKIQQQNMLNGIEENPYFRTHPITSERIAFLQKAATSSPYKTNQALEKRFKMIQAKLHGFLDSPGETLSRYPETDKSAPARYARSIAYFKIPDINASMKNLDSLIADYPENPFFYELKGQIYAENGKIFQARQAYQKALDLHPASALFQINLAQIMLEAEPSSDEIKNVISLLNKALVSRPDSYSWLLLSRAYGMNGDKAYAAYAAAEFSLRSGETDTAERQIETAFKNNPSRALSLKLEDLQSRINSLQRKKRQPQQSL